MENSSVNKYLPDLSLADCEPPWWASSGHLQTILGHLLPSPSLSREGEALHIALPDGDTLVGYAHPGASDYVVSVFHGLSGDTNADYVRRCVLLCEQLGHTCVRINHRGAGEGLGLAEKPYHSGRSEDVSEVLKFLRLKYPGKKQIAIGFSMSGNIVLHLLSRKGGECLPDAAIVVNAAINVQQASQDLSRGLNRIYDLRFVRMVSEMVKDKVSVPCYSTMHEFDGLYVAPAGGFRDRDHYYDYATTKNHLQQVQTPTYALTAADDPFVRAEDYQQAPWSDYVNLHIADHGGHLGYLSQKRTPLGTRRWLDHYICEALQSLTQYLSK